MKSFIKIFLLLALSFSLPAVAQTSGNPKFSSVGLKGSGTSTSDGIILATGGGSVANQGVLNYTAAQHNFYGWDSSTILQLRTTIGSVDYAFILSGNSSFGPTYGCASNTDTNVNCNWYAQGTGSHIFGNGSGIDFETIDAGGATSSEWQATGGISGGNPILSSSTGIGEINNSVPYSYFDVAQQGSDILHVGGIGSASGDCYVTIDNYATSSEADVSSGGGGGNCSTNIRGYLTGGVNLGNGEGFFAYFGTSPTNTIGDTFNFKSASSTDPLRIFGQSGTSIAVGGVYNASAQPTNATNGFLEIPWSNGTPTGTPSTITAGFPIQVDKSDNWFYFYSGGNSAWNALKPTLTGTTNIITGTSLSSSCDSGTVSVSGAVVGSPVSVASTTGADVGGAFNLRASVTSSGTVTVYVCGTGTPSSLAYNVRVLQ